MGVLSYIITFLMITINNKCVKVFSHFDIYTNQMEEVLSKHATIYYQGLYTYFCSVEVKLIKKEKYEAIENRGDKKGRRFGFRKEEDVRRVVTDQHPQVTNCSRRRTPLQFQERIFMRFWETS
jgi:hypothetical protein